MKPNRPLKVLHFVNSPVRAGAEEHMLILLRLLDRSRFRPMLVAPRVLIDLCRTDLPRDVAVFPLGEEGIAGPRALPRLVGLLRRERPDVLHSHMFQANMIAAPAGRMAGVPAIFETTHVRELWRKGRLKGSYLLDRLVGRLTDRFIAVSQANADYLTSVKKIPADKVTVVRNGVDIGRFRSGAATPDQPPVVVVLARLEPQKGHSVLLDAWKLVQSTVPEAQLVFVGDGSLRGQLEAQAKALGIAGSVTFAGYRSDTPVWLQRSTFTVLPSFYEGLPLVAIESLAAARPVVATSVDGTVEVVRHEETGLLTPPGASAPLAQAILRLLQNPEFTQTLGRQGQQVAEREFNQERQVRQTEDLYEEAWLAKRAGECGVPQPVGRWK